MKKWIVRIGVVLVGMVLIVPAAGYLWFQYSIRKSLPQFSGRLMVSGIKEEVEIIRDAYGVPHIYAQNEPDLYLRRAMPWPRIVYGKWSFSGAWGRGAWRRFLVRICWKPTAFSGCWVLPVSINSFRRILHFITNSFANGVNAYLATHSDRLPIEFKLLRLRARALGSRRLPRNFKSDQLGLEYGLAGGSDC